MKITPVKKRLVARGWTQRKIVQATGRHKTEISAVLNGRRYTNSTQKDIAQVVGLSVQELFGDWSYSKRQRKEKKIIKKMDGGGGLWRRQFSHYQAVIYSCKPSDDCGITFISDGVASLLGYEPCEFAKDARLWADHIHPEDAPRVLANLRQLVKHGYYTQEYRFLHKNGTYRRMHDEMKLVQDEAGKPLEIVGYWTDITEYKEAEERLRMISKVFTDVTDAIFIEDLSGNIIDVNTEAEHAYGWTRGELLGKGIDIIIPQERQKAQLALRPLCIQGKDVRSIECLRHSKSGKILNVLLTLSLLTDEAGNPIAIATIAKNITTFRKVEEII